MAFVDDKIVYELNYINKQIDELKNKLSKWIDSGISPSLAPWHDQTCGESSFRIAVREIEELKARRLKITTDIIDGLLDKLVD